MWRRGAFNGAQALLTRCAAAIAGLIFSRNEANRVRDMREYPFWVRDWLYIETVLLPAPRKILRDSPTRRDTPKKTAEERYGYADWSFGQ